MNLYRGRQEQILSLLHSLVITMPFELKEQLYWPHHLTVVFSPSMYNTRLYLKCCRKRVRNLYQTLQIFIYFLTVSSSSPFSSRSDPRLCCHFQLLASMLLKLNQHSVLWLLIANISRIIQKN